MTGFWEGLLAGAIFGLMAGSWAVLHLLAPRRAVTVTAPETHEDGERP